VNRTLTRRRFVAGAAGMAATAALPATAAAKRHRRQRRVDVCIVGAGLAGLTAARNIVRSGRDVVVLEARNRVGGRIQNKTIAPGVITEVGAEYVGPTQDRMVALAKAVGVDTFPTYNQGSNVLILDGQRSLYPATPGVSDNPQFLEAIATIPVLDQMAAEVPVAAPWKAPRADEWDNQTLAQFRDQQIPSAGGRQVFDVASRAIWGTEAAQLSLLYALFYIASAGNPHTPGSLSRLISTPNGAQAVRFVGGSQLVPINLAKRLGARVVLDAPVRRIERSGKTVTVIADGNEVSAQRVIVAVPPKVALDIDYAPALPRAKSRLLRRIVPGTERKWAAIYQRPFWRERGAERPGRRRRRAGPQHLRQHPAPGHARDHVRLRRRRRLGGGQGPKPYRPPRRADREPRGVLRRRVPQHDRVHREPVGGGAVDQGLPGRAHRAQRARHARAAAAQARRHHPLRRY